MGQLSSAIILSWCAGGPGFTPGYPQRATIQIIGPNNFIFQEHCIFWEIIWKAVCKTDYKNLEHNDFQLLTTFMG